MKLLLLDIETAPNIAHVWGLWQQNVGLPQLMDSGYVLCWAAKWHGEKEVHFDSVKKSRALTMIKRIHTLISEADAVVHYNGKSFDMPTLNREFLIHDMSPPAPYKQIDLCRVSKSEFRFVSNKLDYVAGKLQLGHKTKHEGHELWVKCMAGDEVAWKKMEKYNRNDVVLLERLYNRMRPWIRCHPNHGTYDEPGIQVCPNCGSGHLQRRGYARTHVNKFVRLHCQGCGAWSREAASELPKEDRQVILRRVVG